MTIGDHAKPAGVVGLVVATLVLVMLGQWSEEIDDRTAKERLSKFGQATEFIQTTGLRVTDLVQHTTGGRFPSTTTRWVFAESNGWVFLNGGSGSRTCMNALYDVERANQIDSPSLEEVLLWGSAFRDQQITLQALVPRFKQAPDLTRCPGWRYNEIENLLQIGDKKIAYLLKDQPRLAQ